MAADWTSLHWCVAIKLEEMTVTKGYLCSSRLRRLYDRSTPLSRPRPNLIDGCRVYPQVRACAVDLADA